MVPLQPGYSGFCNKYKEYLKNDTNLFLTILEGKIFLVKMLANLLAGEGHFQVHRRCLLAVNSHGTREEAASSLGSVL
jgi:hypothetical protein